MVNGQVEVHYAVDETQVCSTRPCGTATVGVKGYTEACADSDGERHGESLDDLLSAESDRRKVKGDRRNRIREGAGEGNRNDQRRTRPGKALTGALKL